MPQKLPSGSANQAVTIAPRLPGTHSVAPGADRPATTPSVSPLPSPTVSPVPSLLPRIPSGGLPLFSGSSGGLLRLLIGGLR